MTTPANALDITAAGYVKFDGTNVFSGVSTIPIADGGTNANSFSITGGVVTYDGTRLVTSVSSGSVIRINGASINFKTVGNTTCFTTANAAFFLLYTVYVNTALTGSPNQSTSTLGYNATSYDNISGATGSGWSTQGSAYSDFTYTQTSSLVLIPANTAVVLKTTVGSTSTTMQGYIAFVGFYL